VPRELALEPVSEFVTVCSKVPRTVFTFAHAATARSIVASVDCAASGAETTANAIERDAKRT